MKLFYSEKLLQVWKSNYDRDCIKRLTPLHKQILVASGPLISTISVGMTSGFSAIMLPQLTVGKNEASWIASMAALPMAFGCILGGLLMEKFGRKTTQLITTLPCLVGWVCIGTFKNLPMILVGRFLTGLCGGLLGPSTGVYISETSEPHFRDFLLGAISLSIAVGLLIVHFLGTFLDWQIVALISAILPIFSAILLTLVPESPHWLIKNKRIAEAEKAFFWCRDENEQTKKELNELIDKQNLKKIQAGIFEFELIKPLLVIGVFIVVNQWAGVNALTFYTVSIMQDTLNDGLNNYVAMVIVDLIRVVMSILACVIMKKVKRRPLALISGVGTFLSLFLLSGYTYLVKFHPFLGSSEFVSIPMVALISYISFTTLGLVPLPWAMMGEVFPLKSRNVGSGLCSFLAFLAFFSVVKTNPEMVDAIGVDGTFLVYGLVAFFGTIFIWGFLPETKNKTLQEIEDDFSRK